MTKYYINKEQQRARARIEAKIRAAVKAECIRAKAEAEKLKQRRAFRFPKVGDLLYDNATNRLVYCDGKSDNQHILMSFPGEDTPREYTKSEIVNNFRY